MMIIFWQQIARLIENAWFVLSKSSYTGENVWCRDESGKYSSILVDKKPAKQLWAEASEVYDCMEILENILVPEGGAWIIVN